MVTVKMRKLWPLTERKIITATGLGGFDMFLEFTRVSALDGLESG